MKKKQQETKGTPCQKQISSPLLDRHIQKKTAEQMAKINEEVLAKAIKTMLYKDKENNKFYN